MASTAVSAMPHNLHHLPLPVVPRIRPPRMLPGTVSPNSDPQPPGKVPLNSVWVQGKWRNPSSNAAKHVREVVSRQVQKALRHQKHGLDIFAYYHIRTHQVVYSLTRVPQESQIMPQLLFLGKKTKPAAYRRDHWRPYFSVHFPENPAGQRAGLTAYQRLREFAMRRQLSPDLESIRNKQEDVDAWMERQNSVDTYVRMLDQKARPPKIGRIMGLGARARKLMKQKASSVADTALVLKLAVEQLQSLTAEDLKDHTKERLKDELGWRGRKRLTALRQEEEAKKKQIEERQKLLGRGGQLGLNKAVAQVVSMEYGGSVDATRNRTGYMAEFATEIESLEAYRKRLEEIEDAPEEKRVELQATLTEVQVLWADIRDGTYAESWPESIVHADMPPLAWNGAEQWSPHVAARDGTPAKEEMVARSSSWERLCKKLQDAQRTLEQAEQKLGALQKQGQKDAIVNFNIQDRQVSREEAIRIYLTTVKDAEDEVTVARVGKDHITELVPQDVAVMLNMAEALRKQGKHSVSRAVMRRAREAYVRSDVEVPEDEGLETSGEGAPVRLARLQGRPEEEEEEQAKTSGLWSRVKGVFGRR